MSNSQIWTKYKGKGERALRTEDNQSMTAGFQCAGCGQWNETNVDASAGRRQAYVEDCQVCCKPNLLHVSWDMSAAEFTISAQLE